MFCPQCGTNAAETDAFCPMCGADLRSVVTQQPPAAPVEPTPPPQAPVHVPPAAQYTPPATQYAAAAPAAAYTAAGATYSKAPLGARLLALIADGIVGAILMPLGLLLVWGAALRESASVAGFIVLAISSLWQIAYTLGRDGFGGAGPGKRIAGLVVVRNDTGAPAGMGASLLRQFVLLALNSVPVIGSLIEPVLVLTDKDGRRLGDKAAKTQVVRATEVATRGYAVPTGKTAAIIVVIIAFVLGLASTAIGGVIFARTMSGADTSIDLPAEFETGSAEEPTTEAAAGSPEAAVDAFYSALATGDLEAVKATLSEELAFYADYGMLEDRMPESYRIVGSTDQGNGIYNVDVQEYAGDNPTWTYTFILIDEDGQWKIDDWVTAEETPGASSDSGGNGVEAAVDAVGTMLVALQNGDMETVNAYTTDNMKSTHPEFFYSAEGALGDFEIVDAFQDAAIFVVVVEEQWISGPETVMYFVLPGGGGALVDGFSFE